MRVLLTGIAGHIGKAVSRELIASGHEVVGIDILPPSEESIRPHVRMIYGDIADRLTLMSAAEGSDAIIHLAAYAQPHRLTGQEIIRVNVGGTQNILDAAAAHGIRKVVVTSSVGALGFSFPTHPCLPDYLPVDAAHPRRPQDVYGLTKLMNEESAAAATRLHGTTTIVIRPPFVTDVEKHASRAIAWRLSGSQTQYEPSLWSYIDVNDIAVAYRLAIEKEITGHVVLHVMADDVLAHNDAAALIRKFLPDREADIAKLTGKSLYDLRPAEDLLGFRAQRDWRDFVPAK